MPEIKTVLMMNCGMEDVYKRQMSNYAGFMVSRFGSSQSNNYNKYMRPAATSRFTTAAMVKDGKTEYMYDDGEKVYTNTDRYRCV